VKEATSSRAPGEVLHQVLPTVPRKAKETIQGKVRVSVRVRVAPSGNVTGATLDSPGPSRYFAGLALQAARRWKFVPAKADGREIASAWTLRFEFGRTGTKVTPVRGVP
jgi:TonB family protein